jgi:RimJ/RimL family protein N-acetyltransferase
MREIRIDAPGAGEWIMSQVGGRFSAGDDHSFSTWKGDVILGGIALIGFYGNAWTMHMAGEDRWFSRELAWMAFDYAFNQCGCHKIISGVRSDNHLALAIDMRGGWQLETIIRDLYEPGVHMMVLTMTQETCPWLDYHPKFWRSNKTPDIIDPIDEGKVV